MSQPEQHKGLSQEVSHFETYVERMNAGVAEKFIDIIPTLHDVLTRFEHPTIVSVGAGSGKLEEVLATHAPHARVIAMDLSMKMEKTIWELVETEKKRSGHICMETLAGRAEDLPFETESVHAVIASSMVHHPASFQDGFTLGNTVSRFFRESGRVLVPEGRLIIRDFMQPDEPNELVTMRIGEKLMKSDAEPIEFLLGFAGLFKGAHMEDMKSQITRECIRCGGAIKKGAEFTVPAWLATELAGHYSWAEPRFCEEVKERYAYAPVLPYARFVQNSYKEQDNRFSIVEAVSRISPGYPVHVDGRLDFFHKNGTPMMTPVYMGVVGLEKR